jgi:hypothetical protein
MVREEWESKGFFVNWWEVDAFMVQMPWNLKRVWQGRLKELVEGWAGGEELELTDIYGMRRYQEGARLLHHVDREATHAASLIVNVAQWGLKEDWKVEIYDHADRLHEITMKPGDIVYYESAKCLHGRNRPLSGGYYVNLFSHYRPINDPKWFEKPSPAHAGDAILGVGDCVVKAGKRGSQTMCDGTIGPYLSTSAHMANGAESLKEWWRASLRGDGVAAPLPIGTHFDSLAGRPVVDMPTESASNAEL